MSYLQIFTSPTNLFTPDFNLILFARNINVNRYLHICACWQIHWTFYLYMQRREYGLATTKFHTLIKTRTYTLTYTSTHINVYICMYQSIGKCSYGYVCAHVCTLNMLKILIKLIVNFICVHVNCAAWIFN